MDTTICKLSWYNVPQCSQAGCGVLLGKASCTGCQSFRYKVEALLCTSCTDASWLVYCHYMGCTSPCCSLSTGICCSQSKHTVEDKDFHGHAVHGSEAHYQVGNIILRDDGSAMAHCSPATALDW